MADEKDKDIIVQQRLKPGSKAARYYQMYADKERADLVRRGIVLAHEELEGNHNKQTILHAVEENQRLLKGLCQSGLSQGTPSEKHAEDVPDEFGL